MNPHIILGPPGTGKTTRLLELVHAERCSPEAIGFFAYTRKAAQEARQRTNLDDETPFFRTLHSLCFRQLGLTRSHVLNTDKFAVAAGIQLSNREDTDYYSLGQGDRIMRILHLARNQMRPVQDVLSELEGPEGVPLREVVWLRDALMQYKKVNGLYDFTDMLEAFIAWGRSPQLESMYIDEGQDLTRLQWKVVGKLARESGIQRVYVAGDDDQAIYEWNGADIQTFLHLQGSVEVLGQSYRVPRAVQSIAGRLLARIRSRREKVWKSRDEEGLVSREYSLEHIPFGVGSWYVLARNSYHLRTVAEHLRRKTLLFEQNGKLSIDQALLDAVYAWERRRKGHAPEVLDDARLRHYAHPYANPALQWWEALTGVPVGDRAYLRGLLAAGDRIAHPRIRLGTVHGAKGGEADRVLLLTDVSRNSHRSYERNPDAELRVFYVGVTRAKFELYLFQGPARERMIV